MLNKQQIKLVQTAVRAAGLRSSKFDGRYRMLLAQYKQPTLRPVTSCKQLNNSQMTDLLAICESLGWRCPGKAANHFRDKVARTPYGIGAASFAQQSAIDKLRGDLGWDDRQLAGMLKRMTKGRIDNVARLAPKEAHAIIEALKNMFSRQVGKDYTNLNEIKEDVEDATDGKTHKIG